MTTPHLLAQTEASLRAWARERHRASEGAAAVLAATLLREGAERAAPRGADRPSAALLREARARFATALPSYEAHADEQGNVRLVVRLDDGALVEAVLLAYPEGVGATGRRAPRWSVCLSSQVGCRRACAFCETGRLGLARDLAAHEIVAQFALASREARARFGPDARPTNAVFMGMGEPLDNLNAVLQALAVLREPHGFFLAESHVTVSTVGVLPALPRLFAASRCQVALSLHALEPALRRALLPIAHRYSLEQLRDALRAAPRPVWLQWTLLAGRNDAPADAEALAEFARSVGARVNLLLANPGPDPAYAAPSREVCEGFQRALLERGVRATLRVPHGRAIGAACGQLAGARRGAARP